jgi:hypothetical protein
VTRRPVPRLWRAENHALEVYSQRSYYVRGGGYSSRAGGRCDCGATFGLRAVPPQHNMDAADVRAAWLDHVEDAYYAQVQP